MLWIYSPDNLSLIWVVAATTSIVSTRYIFFELGFYYPFHLIMYPFAAILLISILYLTIGAVHLQQPVHWPYGRWDPYQHVRSCTLALSTICASYSILFLPNIPTFTMLSVYTLPLRESYIYTNLRV